MKFAEGDYVRFLGGRAYLWPESGMPTDCGPGYAQITRTAPGTHQPYQLRTLPWCGGKFGGHWVEEGQLEPAPPGVDNFPPGKPYLHLFAKDAGMGMDM